MLHLYHKRWENTYGRVKVEKILNVLQRVFNNLDAFTDYRTILENLQTSVSAKDVETSVDKAEAVAKELVTQSSKALREGLKQLFDACLDNDHFQRLRNGNDIIRRSLKKETDIVNRPLTED